MIFLKVRIAILAMAGLFGVSQSSQASTLCPELPAGQTTISRMLINEAAVGLEIKRLTAKDGISGLLLLRGGKIVRHIEQPTPDQFKAAVQRARTASLSQGKPMTSTQSITPSG